MKTIFVLFPCKKYFNNEIVNYTQTYAHKTLVYRDLSFRAINSAWSDICQYGNEEDLRFLVFVNPVDQHVLAFVQDGESTFLMTLGEKEQSKRT